MSFRRSLSAPEPACIGPVRNRSGFIGPVPGSEDLNRECDERGERPPQDAGSGPQTTRLHSVDTDSAAHRLIAQGNKHATFHRTATTFMTLQRNVEVASPIIGSGQSSQLRFLTHRNIAMLLAKLGISAGLLGLAFHKVGVWPVRFPSVQILPLLLACGIVLGQVFVNSLRWQVLLERTSNHRIELPQAFSIYYLSTFLGQVLPSVAGDLLRILSGRMLRISLGAVTESVVLDRALALVALVVVASFSLPLLWSSMPEVSRLLAAIIIVAVIGAPALAGLIALGRRRAAWMRLPSAFRALAEHWMWSVSSPTGWGLLIPLSLLVHILSSLILYLVAVALGADLSLVQVFKISPLLLLVQVLPVSFGGWGAREAVAVVLFGLVGFSAPAALTVSIAFGLLLLVSTAPSVAVWFFIRPSGSDRTDG
jgi:glycosyltransferase 2 family protein